MLIKIESVWSKVSHRSEKSVTSSTGVSPVYEINVGGGNKVRWQNGVGRFDGWEDEGRSREGQRDITVASVS